MKKQTRKKIFSGLMIFVFLLTIFISPLQAKAANSMSSLYANPNQNNSKNPYKFKVSDVVNSNLLTHVVGCTGVVNKVSTWMLKFVQSPAKTTAATAAKIADTKRQLRQACTAIKAGSEAGVGIMGYVSDLVSPLDTTMEDWCPEKIEAIDDKMTSELIKQSEQAYETNLRTQCLDGIAITLAKNQLTSMTRSAVNWVNSGYGGNPFFVQNMTNLTNNIERNVLETGIDVLLTPGIENPYARDFARSTISGYRSGRGLGSSSSGFLSGLSSDLSSFVSDPKSYYSNEQLWEAHDTRTALQRAQDANNSFANDFSIGGWDGYMALTQRDQNNPLGFTMLASRYLSNTQSEKINETKEELSQNSGFLSQKTCVLYQLFDDKGVAITNETPYSELAAGTPDRIGRLPGVMETYSASGNDPIYGEMPGEEKTTVLVRNVYSESRSGSNPNFDICVEYKNTTPGSIIKDKTTSYLNSPERQLELADTINESLNALFSILISKLEGGGLSGLSDTVVNTTNWTDSINTIDDSSDPYDNNGAYDGFNLTRNLGNTYVHDEVYKAGTWNASSKINLTDKNERMSLGYVPPVYKNGKEIESSNVYWAVTNPGKTILIENGYNNWEKGDRAFWNGSEWQNWKCYKSTTVDKSGPCDNQISPIKERGVIQIQKDYIVAAKEIVGLLPNVMTKLGELDYCIPGPNPSYKTNSTDAQSAYQDWLGSIYVGPMDEYRTVMKIDRPGDRTFDNFANIYEDTPTVWEFIKNSYIVKYLLSSFNSYHYDKNGNYPNSEEEDIKNKTRLMELNLAYVNNSMFQNFYEIFDKMMNKLYFGNMTRQYNESENRSVNIENDKNQGYIPMSESGLDLTKNIKYYDEDIKKAINDYTEAINQAKINISKLEPIRAEVSKIIKAAQDRRDANLLAQINKLNEATIQKCKDVEQACMEDEKGTVACYAEYTKCLEEETATGGILSKDQYLIKYAQCLDEENIQFYDPEELINGGNDPERCFNGIDDDLDRLVDSKDPDCAGVITGGTTTTEPTYRCVSGVTTTTEPGMETSPCVGRSTKDECIGSTYYHQNKETQCDWITGTNPYTTTTSVNGCRIDTSVTMKPMYENATESCLIRTKENCTKTKYISEDHESYSCIFTEV